MGALPLAEKQLIKAAGLDADTFLPGTSYVTANSDESNTVLHKPPLAGGSALIITLPATYENSAGWCVQFWISRAQNRVFMRKREGWTIGYSVWEMFATATPPNWHNAPLETGWSWTTQGKYGKDGSGKVYLVGAVNKASAPLSSEAILRLPVDFRPPVLWPVSFSSAKGTDGSSWATYGYLWPDGYLRFNGGALPANYSLNQGIAFAAEFPAV